jgi:hypothetical protein
MGIAPQIDHLRFLSSAGLLIASAKVYRATFTNAEIKAIPSDPLQIAPAPSITGKYISPLLIEFRLDASAGLYTNIGAAAWSWCGLDLGTSPTTITNTTSYLINDVAKTEAGLTEFFGSASINTTLFVPIHRPDVDWLVINDTFTATNSLYNKPLTYYMADHTGDFTGGNAANTLTVTSFYLEL